MHDPSHSGPESDGAAERTDIARGLELLKKVRSFLRARAADPEHQPRALGSEELIEELERLGDSDERRNGPQAA
jgi:hypothetical protein